MLKLKKAAVFRFSKEDTKQHRGFWVKHIDFRCMDADWRLEGGKERVYPIGDELLTMRDAPVHGLECVV